MLKILREAKYYDDDLDSDCHSNVYIIQFKSDCERTFYKVGICLNLKTRIKSLQSECYNAYTIEPILSTRFDRRDIAFGVEQCILKFLVTTKYLPVHHFSGESECFLSDRDNLESILKFIEDAGTEYNQPAQELPKFLI